jgi:NitT/TauT family transport system substrate-binding protein
MPGKLVTTVLMLALTLGGSAGVGAAAPEKRDILLAVGGKTTLYYLPLTIAERNGYFRDEGLNVEIADFPGGAKALQALIGRSADVVSGAFEHTIVMQTNAIKLQAFVLQGMNPGLELGIARARSAEYEWPKDLKGWRVGVSAPGSSTHMLVNHLLASVGLTPDDVSIIGVGTGPTAVAAVRGGHLDAISSVEPVMTLLEKSGDIRIVVETISDKGTFKVFGG